MLLKVYQAPEVDVEGKDADDASEGERRRMELHTIISRKPHATPALSQSGTKAHAKSGRGTEITTVTDNGRCSAADSARLDPQGEVCWRPLRPAAPHTAVQLCSKN